MGSRVGRPPGSKGGGGGDSWPWAWACWAYRQGNAGFLGPKARPGVVLRTLGGATVLIEGLGISAGTAQSGTYTLTVPADKAKGQTVTLRARNIGYQAGTKQITLTPGTQTQDFQLQFDPFTLNEVVVTGTAGATERKNLTFDVSRVDASQLNEAPAVGALGGLEGKVAGARVIQGSGAPGSDPVIRLRGATAITSQGSCNTQPCPSTAVPGPLVVVDGTITHYSLADISPQDIERVEVVKGAAASSLYGSNAANGVVQIFTKRGDRLPDGRLAVTVKIWTPPFAALDPNNDDAAAPFTTS